LNKKIAVLITVFIACFSATSVLSEDIVRDYDRSFDFSGLKTYRWMDAEKRLIARANPQTASVMSDEELDKIIRAAVDEELKKRGFTLTTGDSADFLTTYFAVGQLDLSGSFYDAAPSGNLPYNHWRPFYQPATDARLNTKGELTIDIVNPENNQLIWRGQASDTIKKTKDVAKTVKKVAKKILSKFPPKS